MNIDTVRRDKLAARLIHRLGLESLVQDVIAEFDRADKSIETLRELRKYDYQEIQRLRGELNK